MIHLRRSFALSSLPLNRLLLKQKIPNQMLRLQNCFSTSKNNSPTDKKANSSSIKQNFSQKPDSNNHKSPVSQADQLLNEEPIFTAEEQNMIKSYEPDPVFNIALDLDPKHNFQKELIVAKKVYEKSTKQLRASILFEDLLKSQISINIYDTKGKPYTHMWIKNLFNIFFFGVTIWFFNSIAANDPKNKVILERTTGGKFIKTFFYGFATWFLMVGFYKYLKFQRRFVQKIIYDTKSQNFILMKRGFFGGSKSKEVSRFKIVYTQNEFLNKKGTNYFNLETKQQYSIPYKDAWIKQDLFSHLICQRIKL